MTTFQKRHLKKFRASLSEGFLPDDLGGKRWKTFSSGLEGVDPANYKPSDSAGRVSRSEVFKLAANDDIPTPTVCAAALAWGGMYMTHHKELFRSAGWIEIAQDLRKARCSRQEAFDRLRDLRAGGALKGFGPAFYTKLIYFLTRREGAQQGYIMDQWAACSINLLTGKPVVHLNCSLVAARGSKPGYIFTVSDLNSGAHYEAFCQAVDALVALDPDYSPDIVDRAFIGTGGKKPSLWREHVIKQRVQ